MGNKIFLLNPSNGKESTLDRAFNKHLSNISKNFNGEEEETRWEIYSIIIDEFLNQNKYEYVNEIKYRITDGEDPNIVILDIIERDSDNIDSVTWFFKRRIEEYIEDDYFKRFLI